jgi:hypothetical protein
MRAESPLPSVASWGGLRGQGRLAYNNAYTNSHAVGWFDEDWLQDKGSKAYNLLQPLKTKKKYWGNKMFL